LTLLHSPSLAPAQQKVKTNCLKVCGPTQQCYLRQDALRFKDRGKEEEEEVKKNDKGERETQKREFTFGMSADQTDGSLAHSTNH
jgi:hypothetical protein